MSALLGSNANSQADGGAAASMPAFTDKYRLLRDAQRILVEENVLTPKNKPHRTRTCLCNRVAGEDTIDVVVTHHDERNSAHLENVQTCTSFWSCPVCADKIAHERRLEIAQALSWAKSHGYHPVMVTFTARHNRGMSLQWIADNFKASYKMMLEHRTFKNTRDDFGWKYGIKATEVLYGKHGWHYHVHLLVFIEDNALITASGDTELEENLYEIWVQCLSRNNMTAVGNGVGVNVSAHGNVPSQYLSKLGLIEPSKLDGLDHEMANPRGKSSKGKSIFALLKLASKAGGERERERYLEAVQALHGERWIVWTRGFKDEVGIADAEPDATELHQEVLVRMGFDLYAPVRHYRAQAELLAVAATTASVDEVMQFLHNLHRQYVAETGRSHLPDRHSNKTLAERKLYNDLCKQLASLEMKHDIVMRQAGRKPDVAQAEAILEYRHHIKLVGNKLIAMGATHVRGYTIGFENGADV